jgi:hypothetical protein
MMLLVLVGYSIVTASLVSATTASLTTAADEVHTIAKCAFADEIAYSTDVTATSVTWHITNGTVSSVFRTLASYKMFGPDLAGQVRFDYAEVTVASCSVATLTVQLPECKAQWDLASAAQPEVLTASGTPGFIHNGLTDLPYCTIPTPPATPTPTPTSTPIIATATPSAPPTPTATAVTPTTPTPTGTPTGTVAGVTSPPSPTGTVQGATSRPRITLPPTDATIPASPRADHSGFVIALLVLAGAFVLSCTVMASRRRVSR